MHLWLFLFSVVVHPYICISQQAFFKIQPSKWRWQNRLFDIIWHRKLEVSTEVASEMFEKRKSSLHCSKAAAPDRNETMTTKMNSDAFFDSNKSNHKQHTKYCTFLYNLCFKRTNSSPLISKEEQFTICMCVYFLYFSFSHFILVITIFSVYLQHASAILWFDYFDSATKIFGIGFLCVINFLHYRITQ